MKAPFLNSIKLVFSTRPTQITGWLISSLIVFIGLNFSSANAETVRLVEDINQYAAWRIRDSVSTGSVAFHLQRNQSNNTSTLWRSTEQVTEKIDLNSVDTSTDNQVRDLFLTQNYLYLRTDEFDLYQMSLDGQQFREVPTPAGRYYFNSPIIGDEPDTIYYLENGPNSNNDGIYLFRLDERAATLTRTGNEIFDRRYYPTNAGFVDDRIVFNGSDALWSIDTTGTNVRELMRFGGTGYDATAPVFGKNLVYFAFKRRNQRECNLWRSDGTVDGTFALTSVPTDYYDNCTFETIATDSDSVILAKRYRRPHRAEIWKTDGTVDGTRQLSAFAVPGFQRQLDLTRAGDQIWYRRETNTGRSVVYVTDLEFATSRRLMAKPGNFRVRFFPLSDHMLVQFSDSINSILYRADHDGANRAALYRGINSLYSSQIAEVGKLAILPFQTTGEPREFLIALDPATRKRTVRLGWRDTNGSSAILSRILEGPDGSVYFCASDPKRNLGTVINGSFVYTIAAPTIWRTDATGQNTHRVVPIQDASITPRSCGEFAAGSEKVYYSRQARIVSGPTQSELWSANLDGTEQKLFINFGIDTGPLFDNSSSPRAVQALADGGVLYTGEYGHWQNRKRVLVRGYADGRYEMLADKNAKTTEIVGQTGNRFWVRSADGPPGSNPTWSLWVTDGSAAGTKLVARRMYANGFVEIDGDVYFTAEFRQDPNRREGLFRVAAGESRPTFVARFDMQRATGACCTERIRLSDFISDLWAYDGDIVFTQKPYTGQANDQLRRFNVATRRETVLFDSSITLGRIKSSAVFNGHVYVFREEFIDKTTAPNWEIWRSTGSPGDALRIHQQNGESARPGLMLKASHGILKATSSAIWFFAGDKRLGNELWQLTP